MDASIERRITTEKSAMIFVVEETMFEGGSCMRKSCGYIALNYRERRVRLLGGNGST